MVEGFTLFTNFKDTEGQFGVGKVPSEIQEKTKVLSEKFYNQIPKDVLQSKTYHQWFHDFSPDIKSIVESIQANPFWNDLCTGGSNCRVLNVPEMDELYYSKAPPKKREDLLLYGATTNYDPHVDGCFDLPGIHFYRVLIGLTPGNKTVETRFLKLGVDHKINENDYIVFDFDKAKHQVVNTEENSDNDKNRYRIILKLHFIVCDNCSANSTYLNAAKQLYINYEIVTRYVMKTGTDPKTPWQFILGLACSLYNIFPYLLYILFIIFTAWPLAYLWKRNFLWKSRLLYMNLVWIGAFMMTSLVLWARYILTGLR